VRLALVGDDFRALGNRLGVRRLKEAWHG
jgi:hypothetical protein